MKFPRHHRLTYPANPTATWRWNKVRQTNPRPQTPIWPWMIAHSVPLSFSLSPTLSLSLSASLPLSLHPSRSLYISSYFYLLLLYSLFYISLFKNDTILKKSKNDRKDSFKGRLVFSSNQHTWSSQKKKKKSTHMDKIHVHIIIIQPLLKKKKSQQKQNYTNNIFFLKKNH